MPKSKLFSRQRDSAQVSADQGQTVAEFGSNGVATLDGEQSVVDASSLLTQFPDLYELGRVGVQVAADVAGDATTTFTVPTGKTWRLLAAVERIDTDASVGNRILTCRTRTAADATIEEITHAAVAADAIAEKVIIFAPNEDAVGSKAVAAQGTITIAEPVTDGDTITVAGLVYTFKTGTEDDQGSTLRTVPLGADEAATKANLVTALKANPFVTVPAAFTGDDLVVTAAQPGAAGDALTFVEDLTHGSNVMDGSGTLGGTTAGVDAADKHSTIEYPTSGPLLTAGEDVHFLVGTTPDNGDVIDRWLIYLEFDNDPT